MSIPSVEYTIYIVHSIKYVAVHNHSNRVNFTSDIRMTYTSSLALVSMDTHVRIHNDRLDRIISSNILYNNFCLLIILRTRGHSRV